MNSKRVSPLVNFVSFLVVGVAASAASALAVANEGRDGTSPVSLKSLAGYSEQGLRKLSERPFVMDNGAVIAGATEATPVDVEAFAPYLEMHGRAEAGVRPVILPWSVRMESVN